MLLLTLVISCLPSRKKMKDNTGVLSLSFLFSQSFFMQNANFQSPNCSFQMFSSFKLVWLSNFPPSQSKFGYCFCKASIQGSIGLPPEVAKEIIFFPERLFSSMKVLMIVGATYHQMG